MRKKRVAVMFGGNSTEYEVSLESAYAVLTHMSREKYDIFPVGITREGKWYHYSGDYENIRENTWWKDEKHLAPAIVSQDPSFGGFLVFYGEGWKKEPVDLAFPVLHGRNGEDGTIQGLFEMAGIPVVGCGVLSSALCMDKDRAHKLAHTAGISVPASFVLVKSSSPNMAQPTSKPGIASSKIMASSYFRAFFQAPCSWSALITLEMPKDEPARSGFTNRGGMTPKHKGGEEFPLRPV